MVELSICNRRFTYIHDCERPIDTHHVIINRSRASGCTACLSFVFLLVLFTSSFYFLLGKDSPATIVSSSCLLSGFFVILKSQKSVKKGETLIHHVRGLQLNLVRYTVLMFLTESTYSLSGSESVIIIPAFGVQLETHYPSGRSVSRFIPVHKIMKPVLVECVTPVTCYWSLSLLLRGEEQLTLVFKELRPPIKMLVPVWKALCAIIDTDQDVEFTQEQIPLR